MNEKQSKTEVEIKSESLRADLFEYLLRLGDDRLVLGHRLSEWCGHGPILEEDIALANVALDFIGQAEYILGLAGEVEGAGRDADRLVYFREAIDYRNLKLVELPRGDFAFTIARQFLFDVYDVELMTALLESSFQPLADVAAKVLKEARYHLRHSRRWVLKLGDGTEESHQRLQKALNEIWMYSGEIFQPDDVDRRLWDEKMAPDLEELGERWKREVEGVLEEATLELPDPDQYMAEGGRQGRHTEHLGHLLSEMQILPRSYPDAKW
ncbi:MAG TPA: 1,2-phenylacetyl-CoA epoxidase subunit PaaC [Acidobacteriota bacterium]|nr:1,2-phenylacetyl-CoA epoxidase subunit PaaC [Acidobacteriota bacterium]